MPDDVLERRRTGWDVVFGILLIAGLIILGDVMWATVDRAAGR
jgi:hypothetical protein